MDLKIYLFLSYNWTRDQEVKEKDDIMTKNEQKQHTQRKNNSITHYNKNYSH